MSAGHLLEIKDLVGLYRFGMIGGTLVFTLTYATARVAGKILGKHSWYSARSIIPNSMIGFGVGGLASITWFFPLKSSTPQREEILQVQTQEKTREPEGILEKGIALGVESDPFFVATASGDLDAVKSLLDGGYYPVFWHPLIRYPKALELFLDHPSTSLIDPPDEDGNTPLSCAVQEELEEAALVLLHHKANPTLPNKELKTPLHYAAEQDRTPLLEALVEDVMEVDIRDREGHTPLVSALRYGRVANVKVLLENAAEAQVAVPFLQTATEEVRKVVESYLPPATQAPLDQGQLRWAIGDNHVHAVKASIAAGLNPCAGDKDTPLHIAALSGAAEVLELLLSARCEINPNVENGNGQTPAQLAASKGHYTSLKLLFDHGAHLGPSTFSKEEWATLREEIRELIEERTGAPI